MSFTWIDDNESLEMFKTEYEANVITSLRRYRRVKRTTIADVQSWYDKGMINDPPNFDKQIEEVEMIEVVMPKDNLPRLISHMDSFLYRKESRERELRNRYESLNKAWEQYQLILALVDDGRIL